jgi:hypothetical protein
MKQLTVEHTGSRRPVTVMPRRLPSLPVAARGKCVSLLQAAKHIQTKPEAVDTRKLRQSAVQHHLEVDRAWDCGEAAHAHVYTI